jgi:hypothetical protein
MVPINVLCKNKTRAVSEAWPKLLHLRKKVKNLKELCQMLANYNYTKLQTKKAGGSTASEIGPGQKNPLVHWAELQYAYCHY